MRLPHLTPALSAPSGAEREIRRLFRERRAAVAVLVAVAAPVLLMSLGLGVETSRWFVAQQELQRTADVAALAGAMAYNQANDAQKGATAAAELAQVNGVVGSSSPTWVSPTLTSGKIVAQIVSGVRSSSDKAMKVTVSQDVPLYLAGLFTSAASKTVTATATAEVITTQAGTPVCLLALNGIGTDVSLSGNANVNAPGCVLRSDAGVSITGNVNVTANAIVAAGSVSVSGNSTTNGTSISQNAGQIPDPYASNSAVQNALSQASKVTAAAITCKSSCSGPPAADGTACCTKGSDGSWTIKPGSYGGISVSSNSTVNLSQGLYLVNGDVSLSGNTAVTANGVTIAATGNATVNGNTTATLTAAAKDAISTPPAAYDPIPGVLFATSSTGETQFNGNNTMPYTGAIYAPKGSVMFSGNATDNASGCAEVFAGTVTLTGNAQMASNCSNYGLPIVYSLPPTVTVSLVQ